MANETTLWMGASIAWLLLLISAFTLITAQGSRSPGRTNRGIFIGSLSLATLIAGAVGLPLWLPMPYTNDALAPWALTLMLWTLAGFLVSFSLWRIRAGNLLISVLCLALALILLPQIFEATSRLQLAGAGGFIWLLYATPFGIGGMLLGSGASRGRRRHTLYSVTWLVVMAMATLPQYLKEMNQSLYTVDRLSTAQLYNPDYVPLVKQAIQSQVQISALFFLGAILLLVLPILRIARPRLNLLFLTWERTNNGRCV